jgi:hypothetical protein
MENDFKAFKAAYASELALEEATDSVDEAQPTSMLHGKALVESGVVVEIAPFQFLRCFCTFLQRNKVLRLIAE